MDQKISRFWVLFSFYMPIMFMISESTYDQIYYHCPNNTMFANNSEYEANLNTLFRYLSSNATNPNGYYQAETSNSASEVVYGHFLCRGDQNTSSCQDCVTTATTIDLDKHCPNRKEAFIWYDECMVRYSNQSFFGKMETWPPQLFYNTKNVTGNVTRFDELVQNMMKRIMKHAAQGGLQKKFATDFANFSNFQTIYGLGQCTPDLSPGDCFSCLDNGVGSYRVSKGARVFQPSCVVRYEIHPFFNLSYLAPPPRRQPMPSPPQESPAGDSTGSSENGKVSAKVIIIIVIAVVAISAILLVLGICFRKKKAKKLDAAFGSDEDFKTLESLQYDLDTLQSATNYFSDENKLGEGGFGGVYKGVLEDGKQIAVKRLSKGSTQGVQQFKNEVLVLAKLRHRNLVRLLGFCLGKEEKVLVYEYVANKSLDYFLFDPEKQGLLDWSKRYKIIGGIARGILYLHEDSDPNIIHRDLKAGNVLLDKDMNPKVADFGMARIFCVDQTHANTRMIVGTYGYMSPEYAMHGEFSTKSDVYSFGVLVLEIISGMKNNKFYQADHVGDLPSYAWKQWRDEKAMDFVDPSIRESCSSEEVLRCMHLGLLCVEEAMDNRPSMSTVVRMLQTKSVSLRAPQEPGFFSKRNTGESSSFKEILSNETLSKSVNDITETEFYPR